jgi:hypothetical protein
MTGSTAPSPPWPTPSKALRENWSSFVNVVYGNLGPRVWSDFMKAPRVRTHKVDSQPKRFVIQAP